jgi:hypothetical protein
MALMLSTGARQAQAGARDSITAATISFDAATKEVRDSENGLFNAGFRPGDPIKISGSGSNDKWDEVVSVASDGSKLVVSGTLVNESAGATVTIKAAGKSFKDIFRNHEVRLFSGSPPSSADDAEGVCLAIITKGGETMTPGTSTNGMSFGEPSGGVINKADEVQQGLGLVAGTAGYYRCYDNGVVTGESATAKRMQGTVGTTSGDLRLTTTSISPGVPVAITQHKVTFPASRS